MTRHMLAVAIALLCASCAASPALAQDSVSSLALPADGRIQYAAPTTGQTVVSDGSGTLILNPAGTLATLTVTVPANPYDGQEFQLCSTQILTALTMNGGTIKGALTTTIINGFGRWKYSVSAAGWVRMF